MDIVVTLPQKEYYRFEKELGRIKSGQGYVWYLWNIPSELNEGDRVYIIKQNRLMASMRVVGIFENKEYLDATTAQLESAAKCLVHLTDYQEEEPLKIEAFGGFRYKRW